MQCAPAPAPHRPFGMIVPRSTPDGRGRSTLGASTLSQTLGDGAIRIPLINCAPAVGSHIDGTFGSPTTDLSMTGCRIIAEIGQRGMIKQSLHTGNLYTHTSH